MPMRPKTRLLLLGDLGCAILGSLLLALDVPWHDLLSTSIPGGGDNPAHPVLMQNVADAFLHHGSIIHYSYSFWSGFELFQFYFPLPYLFGGILGKVIDPNIAFKLTTLLPILLMPPAFYVMARLMSLGRTAGAMASLLAVAFLHTDAHVMWGGNISSTLAGMIGNTWAFVFFVICVGALFRARDSGKFSILAVITFVAAALSHFYAALMLFVLCSVFVSEDLLKFALRNFNFKKVLPSYLACIVSGVLLAWWVFPLMYYSRYSTDFGANWNVELLKTFTHHELVFAALTLLIIPGLFLSAKAGWWRLLRLYLFIVAVLLPITALAYYSRHITQPTPQILATLSYLAAISLAFFLILTAVLFVRAAERDWTIFRVYLFGGIFVALFYANEFLNSTAFLNIRLWPSIYFSTYLLIIIVFGRLSQRLPVPVTALCACLFLFITPAQESFDKSRSWMEWNFSGVNGKSGAQDYVQIVQILRTQPPGRVSFESADANNGIFGTVRAFELLPFLTPHQIVEGGILNSARFPGVAYSLQCLASNSCAGWPAGSVMPGTDIPRAIEVMRTLGISYHIAVSENAKKGFEDSGLFYLLYRGKYASLYAAKLPSTMVEAYDSEVPVIQQKWPYTSLLNQVRWDRLRPLAFAYNSPLAPGAPWTEVKSRNLFNFLVQEWYAGRRVSHDLGWPAIDPNDSSLRLNAFIFSLRRPFHLEHELQDRPDFFIADRGFDPDLYVSNLQYGNSELALPLLRREPGVSEVILHGKGYFAFIGETQVPFEKKFPVNFSQQTFEGESAPFVLITFKNDPAEKFRYVDARTEDPLVTPGLPGPADIPLPENITKSCAPTVEQSFAHLTLHTKCPGKPHLLKYSYYPKWQADVPIYLGSNGYMLLVPKQETTDIHHKPGTVDLVSSWISLLGLFGLIGAGFWKARHS